MNENRKRYSECIVCGEAILKKTSRYCKSCQTALWKSRREKIECLVCGKVLELAQWERSRKYCSRECFSKIPKLFAVKWTDEEKQILREHFADSSKEEILALIPRKSYGAIYRLSSTYELRKSKKGFFKSLEQRSSGFKPWTDEELKILIHKYADTSFDEMNVLLPDRSEHSIRVKAHRLGLHKTEEMIIEQMRRNILWDEWEKGESVGLYPAEFNDRLRNFVRERDNYQCRVCGAFQLEYDRKLSVHHIDYDKQNSLSNNLISLCVDCHMETNYNRDYWQIIFRLIS